MATLAITIPVSNANAGSTLRAIAKSIYQISATVPDAVTTGASVVLTIDNAPATGIASVQLTAGPYQSSAVIAG